MIGSTDIDRDAKARFYLRGQAPDISNSGSGPMPKEKKKPSSQVFNLAASAPVSNAACMRVMPRVSAFRMARDDSANATYKSPGRGFSCMAMVPAMALVAD